MSTESTNTPAPRRRRLRLTTVESVRGYLAGCLQRLENCELDENATKARAYICQTLVKIMETSSLEDRVAQLEAAQNDHQKQSGSGLRAMKGGQL